MPFRYTGNRVLRGVCQAVTTATRGGPRSIQTATIRMLFLCVVYCDLPSHSARLDRVAGLFYCVAVFRCLETSA